MDINLLPWREELQEENRRRFFLALGGIGIFCALFLLSLHIYLSARIDNQNSRNNYLTQQVNFYQEQIQQIDSLKKARQDLIDRMKVIQGLQAIRPFTVQLFDAVVRVIPNGLYISSIKRSGNSVAIDGKSQSHEYIAALMRNVDKSPLFSDPQLQQVKTESGEFQYQFTMTFTITPTSKAGS